MHTHRSLRLAMLVFAGVAYGASASAQNLPQLPIAKTIAGQSTEDQPATYRFNASAAGVLTVAVAADDDVSLTITDAEGQALPDGTADVDLFGVVGNEQLVVTLPEAGEYRVLVRKLSSGSTKFQIGGAWVAMPAFARASDPDRRPSLAATVEVGQSREDSLNHSQGDSWDWYALTPKTAGTLTVILRAVNDSSPDLALELYSAKDLTKPAARADDDQQGNTSNESASMDVAAGEKIYIKVLGAVGSATGPYRLASSLIQ